jgi:NitT/TauT family transport system substrate-binding protein
MLRPTLVAFAIATVLFAGLAIPAKADDSVCVAVPQKGSWDSYISQYAIEQGLFKRERIEPKISYTSGGSDTIQAVVTGSCDIGMSTGTSAVITAFVKGAPLRIAGSQQVGAGDLYWYVKADSPINKLSDLDGKSIGYTRPGSSSFTLSHMLAEQEKIKLNYIASGEMPATMTMVMSGQIDVGWGVVPNLLDQIAAKKIKMIARGSDIKAISGQTIRVHFANATFLKDRHDVGVRFFRAYAAALDGMYKNLDASLASFAKWSDMPPDQAKLLKPYLSAQAAALYPIRDFERSIQEALDLKMITAPLTDEQKKTIFDILPPH